MSPPPFPRTDVAKPPPPPPLLESGCGASPGSDVEGVRSWAGRADEVACWSKLCSCSRIEEGDAGEMHDAVDVGDVGTLSELSWSAAFGVLLRLPALLLALLGAGMGKLLLVTTLGLDWRGCWSAADMCWLAGSVLGLAMDSMALGEVRWRIADSMAHMGQLERALVRRGACRM